MKPISREWVAKAEADFVSARREFRARVEPNYDDTCFHCQQCAEKYLKARLQEIDVAFSKTHNLITLLEALLPDEPVWNGLRPELQTLNIFAVDFRYPGETADKEMAQTALAACSKVREALRKSLGLKSGDGRGKRKADV
jgi:HEPN domain-containing protein